MINLSGRNQKTVMLEALSPVRKEKAIGVQRLPLHSLSRIVKHQILLINYSF